MSSSKDFLYSWLGKQKKACPMYNCENCMARGVQRFKCTLRVPGYAYAAVGNSTNKKDSQTNAAIDFLNYLVRQGEISQDDIPKFNVNSLESTVDIGNSMPSFPQSTAPPSWRAEQPGPSEEFNQFPGYQLTNRDLYVTQRADEVSQSEAVDLKAEIHGGWTIENSKQALNEFLAKLKQPLASYQTAQREAGFSRDFHAVLNCYIPHVGKYLRAEGAASTKKMAEANCAMSMVRQLFHMKLMAAFQGGRKRMSRTDLPPIPVVRLNEVITESIRTSLSHHGIIPADPGADFSSAEFPKSLILDHKLAHFPDSEISIPCMVSWSPPQQNWNPWRACNIDEPPLAFMPLADISEMVDRREKEKFIGEDFLKVRQTLPVAQFRQQIIQTVANNCVTLIKGETGCGKSTQVVQYILESYLEAGKGAEFNAFVSQPRRISAISLAERVAVERGEELGDSVGYGVRFDTISPRPYGSIFFCTVGVLLRKMESGLRGISHVIIDEIHERDIDTDFVLVVLREMVREFRDLRIVLMSATIDTKLFTDYFGNCPVIEMHGRTHPVERFFLEDIIPRINYMPSLPQRRGKGQDDDDPEEDLSKNLNILPDGSDPILKQAMSRMNENEISNDLIEVSELAGQMIVFPINRWQWEDTEIYSLICRDSHCQLSPFSAGISSLFLTHLLLDICNQGHFGAVLIFLPGWQEIMNLFNQLSANSFFGDSTKFVILPLHSQLTRAEQCRVFEYFPEGVRKIILSTNIAETSVTIDDVVYVIDSCKSRERLYSTNTNMVHYATVWASRSNMKQRCGRAGRVRPGFAFHLCSKSRFEALDEHRTAEILRTPLTSVALTIKLLHLGSVGDFLAKAIEPPPVDMVVESEAVLKNMGALDNNLELTPLGRILARLPIEPGMGKTIVLACSLGIGSLMCELAAASSFSTPFVPRERTHTRLSGPQRSFSGNRYSDHIGLIAVNQQFNEVAEQGFNAEQSFIQRFSLSSSMLKMSKGARNQLLDTMAASGFPMNSLLPQRANISGEDENLDLLTSLLISAYYPNVGFFKGKRKVYTLEQATALVSKMSVVTPFKGDIINLPSPLIVFSEKIRARAVQCKEISVINAFQLLLFGSRKVECVGKDLVRLDDMILLQMDPAIAAMVVALRPIIEGHLIRTCMNPESLEALSEQDRDLINILRFLSRPALFSELKDYLLTDEALQGVQPVNRRGGGRGGNFGGNYRGAGAHNQWGFGGNSYDSQGTSISVIGDVYEPTGYGQFANNQIAGGKWPWSKGNPTSYHRGRGGFGSFGRRGRGGRSWY